MTDSTVTETDPWDEIYDELVRYAWQPALRFALDGDGAPRRCGRRACKLAGECCMNFVEGQPLACGGGLSDETLRNACNHILFGLIMVRRISEDVGTHPYAIRALMPKRVDAPPAPVPASRRRKRS